MKQEYFSHNFSDANGNPSGGHVYSTGLCIAWQNGPLGARDNRQPANGCFVETVVAACISRLEYYQRSTFACEENAEAIKSLESALYALDKRSVARTLRGVEGTHEV